MKAAWEVAEDDFDAHWKRMGKRAHLFEFKDARALRGMNKRPTAVGKQPSDRLITFDGCTFFAEVKHTTDKTAFHFGNIQPGQKAFATLCTAAGGDYRIYIRSEIQQQWYCVPFRAIQSHPKQSMSWAELAPYKVSI
jgi:penicillin-binding protein-related factor A (putative recombinase)